MRRNFAKDDDRHLRFRAHASASKSDGVYVIVEKKTPLTVISHGPPIKNLRNLTEMAREVSPNSTS